LSAETFPKLRARLLARFPSPIPTSLTVRHLGCGGEVAERNKWEYDENGYQYGVPHRLQCEHGEYETSYQNPRYAQKRGCGGVWLVEELDAATEEQLSQWFTCSDNDTYSIVTVNPGKDRLMQHSYSKLVKK
jgi:hypothetical protein